MLHSHTKVTEFGSENNSAGTCSFCKQKQHQANNKDCWQEIQLSTALPRQLDLLFFRRPLNAKVNHFSLVALLFRLLCFIVYILVYGWFILYGGEKCSFLNKSIEQGLNLSRS